MATPELQDETRRDQDLGRCGGDRMDMPWDVGLVRRGPHADKDVSPTCVDRRRRGPRAHPGPGDAPRRRGELAALVVLALAALRLFDIEALGRSDNAGARQRLGELLDDTGQRLFMLSDALTRAYFSHIRERQALGYDMALA